MSRGPCHQGPIIHEPEPWESSKFKGSEQAGSALRDMSGMFTTQTPLASAFFHPAVAAATHGGGGGGRLFAHMADDHFMTRARQVFVSYDPEARGALDRQGAKLAWIALLGRKPSRCELAELLSPAEAASRSEGGRAQGVAPESERESMSPRVEWEQFAQAAARRRAGMDGSDEVRQAFRAFDRRCAGFLTLSDVKGVFREVAPHVAERTIEAIFFEFDDDRDGRVNFAQFERLWQNGA